MSSLDSALGALSSTAVTDFYRPLAGRRKGHTTPISERRCMMVARFFTFSFGVLLAAVALAFANYDELLWEVFRWASLISSGMLGVFILGVSTKSRGHDRINATAMLSSVALLAILKYTQEHYQVVYIAWPWWVVIGTAWTYGTAVCFRTRPRQTGVKQPTQGIEP